jgi:predicted metal-dependent HD superfamily phosphohydrolase
MLDSVTFKLIVPLPASPEPELDILISRDTLNEASFSGSKAKNKGKIDMYFVDRIKEELSDDDEGLLPNEEFKIRLNTVLFYEINFKKSTAYIMSKLKNEISEKFYYHSLEHTIDVVNAAERLANLEGIKGEDILLLKTAAMFHDAGFLVQYKENEVFGAEMAKEALPKFGYNQMQIDKVVSIIMATKIPHNPQNELEKIICDADLDYLGRDDYYPIAANLGREFMENGIVQNEEQWLDMQIHFLEKHRYFTDSAIRTRMPGKLKRLEELKTKKASRT